MKVKPTEKLHNCSLPGLPKKLHNLWSPSIFSTVHKKWYKFKSHIHVLILRPSVPLRLPSIVAWAFYVGFPFTELTSWLLWLYFHRYLNTSEPHGSWQICGPQQRGVATGRQCAPTMMWRVTTIGSTRRQERIIFHFIFFLYFYTQRQGLLMFKQN